VTKEKFERVWRSTQKLGNAFMMSKMQLQGTALAIATSQSTIYIRSGKKKDFSIGEIHE
jgi:hypothetical protein